MRKGERIKEDILKKRMKRDVWEMEEETEKKRGGGKKGRIGKITEEEEVEDEGIYEWEKRRK